METLRLVPSLADRAKSVAGFVVEHLTTGAWGELGDRYGVAVGGHDPHIPTIKPPVKPEPRPQGPNGSNIHVRLKDPVEHGWEVVEPREEAA